MPSLARYSLVKKGLSTYNGLRERFRDLPPHGKAFVCIYFALKICIIALVIWITPTAIFEALASWAVSLRSRTLAPLYLILGIILTGIPPLMGYGTLVTVCGFAYGVFWGWIVASAGCLTASAVSLILMRRCMQSAEKWLARQPSFAALSSAAGRKGLSLLILIRLCPFPFSYSNLFFASLPASNVTLPRFLLATLCTTPKLLLHVFIGSRMFLLADPTSRAELDGFTKFLNVVYIVAGSALGIGTGTYVYRLTMRDAVEGDITLSGGDEEAGIARTMDEEEDEIRRELLGFGCGIQDQVESWNEDEYLDNDLEESGDVGNQGWDSRR